MDRERLSSLLLSEGRPGPAARLLAGEAPASILRSYGDLPPDSPALRALAELAYPTLSLSLPLPPAAAAAFRSALTSRGRQVRER
jgi:hypothetical protein